MAESCSCFIHCLTKYEKEILSVIKFLQACFHCRQTGHLVSECPLAQDAETGVGNCYKCGSSEHTTKSCDSKSTEAAGKLAVLIKTGWCMLVGWCPVLGYM